MFTAQLAQALELKQLVVSIKDLTQHLSLKLSSGGITTMFMDSAHITFLKFQLNTSSLLHYSCQQEGVVSVSMNGLKKALLLSDANDEVEVCVRGERLVLKFTGRGGDRVKEFRLKIVDVHDMELDLPEFEPESQISMPSYLLEGVLHHLFLFSERLEISTFEDRVEFGPCKTDIEGKVTVRNRAVGISKTTVNTHMPLKQLYSLRYLDRILRLKLLSRDVTLRMNEFAPLEVAFRCYLGELRCFLAPVVED